MAKGLTGALILAAGLLPLGLTHRQARRRRDAEARQALLAREVDHRAKNALAVVQAVLRLIGAERAIIAIVLVCAVLTYGGVSLFVVVFAVYPFAAEMFRQSDIPKRLIPATIALGAFSFTMDALPGTPQIQNIIPTTFFGTTSWAAPWLGVIGTLFVFSVGMLYLRRQLTKAKRNGEGYGTELRNEPETAEDIALPNPWLALSPLLLVLVGLILPSLTRGRKRNDRWF